MQVMSCIFSCLSCFNESFHSLFLTLLLILAQFTLRPITQLLTPFNIKSSWKSLVIRFSFVRPLWALKTNVKIFYEMWVKNGFQGPMWTRLFLFLPLEVHIIVVSLHLVCSSFPFEFQSESFISPNWSSDSLMLIGPHIGTQLYSSASHFYLCPISTD